MSVDGFYLQQLLDPFRILMLICLWLVCLSARKRGEWLDVAAAAVIFVTYLRQTAFVRENPGERQTEIIVLFSAVALIAVVKVVRALVLWARGR